MSERKDGGPAAALVDSATNAADRGLSLYICTRCWHRQEDVDRRKWRCRRCGAEYYTDLPYDYIIQAFTSLYGERDLDVWFSYDMDSHGALVIDGEDMHIELSVHVPFVVTPEILAHELAHVATLGKEEHGDEWEAAFSAIQTEYARLVKQREGR